MSNPNKLSDAVLARATNSRHGFIPWYLAAPTDVQKELVDLRARWRSGDTGLQKRAFARAVIAEMQSRGLRVCGIQGVEHWLERDD